MPASWQPSHWQSGALAFASAAVPSVQANIADKIYLSSFTPLNESSVWPGRLDAFLKPLPVDADGLPDRSVLCQSGVIDAECFAWDAGDSQPAWDGDAGYSPRGLLLQAPLLADITRFDNSTLDIGTAGELILVRIRASHFLRKMVRRIVGTLVEIGRGAQAPALYGEALEAGPDVQIRYTAPPSGLFLEQVIYAGESYHAELRPAVAVRDR